MAVRITRSDLLEMLKYDRATGEFRWKKSQGRNRAGSVAGTIIRGGARKIVIGKVPYLAHHLAWLVVTGDWSVHPIYHRDGNLDGNWFDNLTVDRDEHRYLTSQRKKKRAQAALARDYAQFELVSQTDLSDLLS